MEEEPPRGNAVNKIIIIIIIIIIVIKSYSAFNRNFLTYCECAAFSWVLSITKKNLRIAEFFASLPFLTYISHKRLKPSKHFVQL